MFTKLDDNAIIPKRNSQGAAGFDLYALKDAHLYYPGERIKINTGIACAIPEGFAGFIKPRSSLAVNSGIDVLAGVIDSDYRGEIVVVLINHGQSPVHFQAGDRIAQIVFQLVMIDAVEVHGLDDTARGLGGFGSTGK